MNHKPSDTKSVRPMRLLVLAAAFVPLLAAISLRADPVYGQKIVLAQPDGTKITAYIYGDEYHLRVESEAGYTLIKNEQTGWIEYAILRNDRLVPSGFIAGRIPAAALRRLRISKHVSDRAFRIEAMLKSNPEVFHEFPLLQAGRDSSPASPQALRGTRKIFVCPVEFQPEESPPTVWSKGTYSPSGFGHRIFSIEPGTSSMANFYRANSYGQFWPEGIAYSNWVTLPRSASFYKEAGSWRRIIEDALDEIKRGDPSFDFALYANSGELDLIVIWAGTTQAWSTFYWPHSSSGGISKYGISVRHYNAVNERNPDGSERSEFGVFCHEYGHMTGAPDLYDYSSFFNRPVGFYCIMGASTARTHFCGYVKWRVYGWITPQFVQESGSFEVDAMGLPLASRPRLVQIGIDLPKEYLLVENRDGRVDPYDAYPGRRNGLLISHIDENYPAAAGLPSYAFYGVEAIAPGLNPYGTTLSEYSRNWTAMAFAADYGYDRVENSYPDNQPPGAFLRLTSGDDTENVIFRNTQGHASSKEIAIRNIGPAGTAMSFSVEMIGAPLNFSGQKVLNRSLLQKEYVTQLTWDENPLNKGIAKYRVYVAEAQTWRLLGETPAAVRKFLHRKVFKEIFYDYRLVAVNGLGREGLPATSTVR